MKSLTLILRIVLLSLLIYYKFHYQEWLEAWKIEPLYINVIINFFLFALSFNLVVYFFAWLYRRRKSMSPEEYDNVTIGLGNVYYLILTLAFIFTIPNFFGIDSKTLFTSLSIVAAAIAIVTKEYLSEIISGIILSFSKEISVGDYLKIGDHKGKIVDLNFTKTVFLNEDDDIVLLPNYTVFGSQIINYSKNKTRLVSIEFEVMLDAIKTIDELERNLVKAVKDYHDYIEPKSFNLKIEAIYKDYLHLKFQYIFKEGDRKLEEEIRRATVRRVVNYVKGNSEKDLTTPKG